MQPISYHISLIADSKQELEEQIAQLAAEWLSGESDTNVVTPDTPSKSKAHQKVGTEEEQPDLPLNEPEAKTATEKVEANAKAASKAKKAEKQEPAAEEAKAETGAKAEEEVEETPAPAESSTGPVSVDVLRDQLMAYAEQHGNTKAKGLVSEWGKVSKVPTEERNRIFLEAGGEL